MIDVPNDFNGHCWILADGSSWPEPERKAWGASSVTCNSEGVHIPGEPALLAYRPGEHLDPAIVEAYALAFGLRLQRCLADKGTYAPVVIDRPAALANIMAEIEGRGPRALG